MRQDLALHAQVPFENGFHAFDKPEGAGCDKPVEDLKSAFVIGDDARGFEEGKVTGHGGHVGADHGGEFADAVLAFGKGLDDKDAGGMGEGLDDTGAFTATGKSFFIHEW